jgi:hypothetical protein
MSSLQIIQQLCNTLNWDAPTTFKLPFVHLNILWLKYTVDLFDNSSMWNSSILDFIPDK